ncbi:hypothetical protein EJD97_016770 [Solanum chilense]|uniref:Uncharacterized protein n=1 Tax=Solanum chilense TaxID=4083 RepID=A0A6N2C9H1_SOLCI|nr:hypothetical protein EJD97_016770 [Solanum chilense]
MATRRLKEEGVNDEVSPQVEKVPQGEKVPILGKGNEVPVVPPDMTRGDIRETLHALVSSITTHVNRSVEPSGECLESIMTSRLRDFVSMNPLIFLGSKVGEYPKSL